MGRKAIFSLADPEHYFSNLNTSISTRNLLSTLSKIIVALEGTLAPRNLAPSDEMLGSRTTGGVALTIDLLAFYSRVVRPNVLHA